MAITDIFYKRHGIAEKMLEKADEEKCDKFFRQFVHFSTKIVPTDGDFDFCVEEYFWRNNIYDILAYELGNDLPLHRHYRRYKDQSISQCIFWIQGEYSICENCENWMILASEKMSLVELFLQGLEKTINNINYSPKSRRLEILKKLQKFIDEVNTRLRENGIRIRYYNGRLEPTSDSLVEERVEKVFWDLISEDRWRKASDYMKEAIDRMNSDSNSSVSNACLSLESVIKEVCQNGGGTIGKCASKLQKDERISKFFYYEIKKFDAHVRSSKMHTEKSSSGECIYGLSHEDVEYIISYTMVLIKRLIQSS